MTQTILTLTIAYALLAAIAMLLVFNSRIHWILRGGLTLAVVALMFLTYRGIGDLRGLPSDDALPAKFRLYWAQIEEPDKLTGAPGSVFLWIRELDQDNYEVGLPRAHKLPYSEELARLVVAAQLQIQDGEDISGEVDAEAEEEETSEELAFEVNSEAIENSGTRVGERFVDFDFGSLSFRQAPAPVTPDKGE